MKELLKSIRSKKITVIGDIGLDHYIIGKATRISPEAPVPIILFSKEKFVPGLAANVALNVYNLGARVKLYGNIGKDIMGEKFIKLINKSKPKIFNQSFQDKNYSTLVKTRIIANNQQMCRIDIEKKHILKNKKFQNNNKIYSYLKKDLKECDAIIFSDYAKGFLKKEMLKEIVKISKKNNCFIAFDPKPQYGGFIPKKLDLLTPNQSEAIYLSKLKFNNNFKKDKNFLKRVCWEIWKLYYPKLLVITLGADGILISKKGKIKKIIPSYSKKVFDVSGAGDTVIASLVLALNSKRISEIDAVKFANFTASKVINKLGTSPIKIIDIK
jgi:rfaE bifunctional protein kinase chain/domain